MTVVFPSDHQIQDDLAGWCAEQIGHVGPAGFGPCRAAAVMDQAAGVLAVVVFHDWQPGSRTMQVSGAALSPRWAVKGNIRQLLDYPFTTAGAHKLWAATPSDRTARFLRALGFRQEGVLRHHFGPKCHATICGMIASEWRERWRVEPADRAAA